MRIYGDWTLGIKDSKNAIPSECFPANVPGGAQLDYAGFHSWQDYNYGENVRNFDGLEEKYWIYQTKIELPVDASDKEIFFIAKGIDYEFEILLNDKSIFYQEGMFTTVSLNLTGKIKSGDSLSVLIYPAPKREGAKPHDREEADQCCKPAVSYGWDWHPYLVPLGIWDECYFEITERARITECELFYTLNEDFSKAAIHFQTATSVASANCRIAYVIYDDEGNVVAKSYKPDFDLLSPQLWWCNGQGTPYLYTWKAILEGSSQEWHGKVGFRTIDLTMNANDWRSINGTRPNPPMTITLNGRNIFGKGSNWVNPEIFPGTITRELYRELLLMAKDANMNLLRTWGGAIVNKESFFELCDEYGIMVWQEFPLSCNNYRDNGNYLKILEQEAVSIVKKIRQHPCHVLWCGGNELFCGWSRMTDQSAAIRLLNKVCYELDKTKPFIPTSPIMGVSHGSYVFLYLDGRDVFTVSQNRKMTAYTEFGIPCLPDADYLESFIPKDELFPPQAGGSYELHHAFHAWGGKEPWLCRPILEYYFGEAHCLEDLAWQSQWLQREGYKAFFEEARRQKPFCSMAVNWCYNEPWKTAANNSIIAYPTIPKAGYSAVAESCRDLLASAKIPKFLWYSDEEIVVEPWILNDSPKAYPNFTLQIYIEMDNKKLFISEWISGAITANENKHGKAVSFRLPEMNTDEFIVSVVCKENYLLNSEYRLKYKSVKPIKIEVEDESCNT